jgi:hypothetical protein
VESVSLQPLFSGSFWRVLSFAVAAAALGAAAPAYAQSGDGGDASPFAASALCSGAQDVVIPCRAGSEQCELTPNGTSPVGFCEDGVFDDTLREVLDGDLERNVTIDATSYGVVTLLNGSIIYCRTFAQATRRVRGTLTSSGIKVCAQISEGTCATGSCPANCSGFLAVAQSTCVNETAELAATLAPNLQPQDLAFIAGVDYDRLAQPGSDSLKVCTGHRWQCFDPASTATTSGKADQLPFADVETPGCRKIGGTTYCSPLL